MRSKFRRLPVLVASLTAFMLLLSPMAQATKLKHQNLTQLIQTSDSIIAGTVKKVTDGIDQNGMPYTEVTIAVGSAPKGKIGENTEYTFRQFGLLKPRTLDNGKQLLAVTPEGFPTWHEGEFTVAFMYTPARISGLQTTAGLAQGKLDMVNGKLVNQFNNIGLFDGVQINDALMSPEQQNMLTNPGAVDAGAFLDLVGRAVQEQWIENGEMQ